MSSCTLTPGDLVYVYGSPYCAFPFFAEWRGSCSVYGTVRHHVRRLADEWTFYDIRSEHLYPSMWTFLGPIPLEDT